jgi:hypothetical protein
LPLSLKKRSFFLPWKSKGKKEGRLFKREFLSLTYPFVAGQEKPVKVFFFKDKPFCGK